MSQPPSYPLAAQGIYHTIQGEGALLGVPMVFVRLAGCSIGCAQCDTDYRLVQRLTASEIAGAVIDKAGSETDWVWLTGGEPTDHDLLPLVETLRRQAFKVAVATAGTRPLGDLRTLLRFVSVSPHGRPDELRLLHADQINLVPGLGRLRLEEWESFHFAAFDRRYITPLWYGPGERAERLQECLDWIARHPRWRLGIQAHRHWGLP